MPRLADSEDEELIAEVQGYKVYISKKYKEYIENLGLTSEQEQKILDKFLWQLAQILPPPKRGNSKINIIIHKVPIRGTDFFELRE